VVNNFNCRGFGPLLEDKLCLIFKLAPSVCRMTFPILASLLVRLVVLLPFQLLRLSLALSNRYKLITNVRSSLMAVNIHITIIELNALHTKRQNLFQELDAVIHLLMEAKHWGLRKSRNATSLNSRFKSLDTLKVKIISVTFRRVIRTNHKKASKIWRHENIQLGGCQS